MNRGFSTYLLPKDNKLLSSKTTNRTAVPQVKTDSLKTNLKVGIQKAKRSLIFPNKRGKLNRQILVPQKPNRSMAKCHIGESLVGFGNSLTGLEQKRILLNYHCLLPANHCHKVHLQPLPLPPHSKFCGDVVFGEE